MTGRFKLAWIGITGGAMLIGILFNRQPVGLAVLFVYYGAVWMAYVSGCEACGCEVQPPNQPRRER